MLKANQTLCVWSPFLETMIIARVHNSNSPSFLFHYYESTSPLISFPTSSLPFSSESPPSLSIPPLLLSSLSLPLFSLLSLSSLLLLFLSYATTYASMSLCVYVYVLTDSIDWLDYFSKGRKYAVPAKRMDSE